MAGTSPSPQRQANLERGFEFSRLQEDWLAAAYALVVPGRCRSPRLVSADGESAAVQPSPHARPHKTERKAI
jgi:hypothetical protein